MLMHHVQAQCSCEEQHVRLHLPLLALPLLVETLLVSGEGGGMFVGCVVAGSVMLVGSGAAVRGALIRDVSAYAIAASAVALLLHSGQVFPCIAFMGLHAY